MFRKNSSQLHELSKLYKGIFFNNFEPFNVEIGQEMKFSGLVLLCNQIDCIIVPFCFCGEAFSLFFLIGWIKFYMKMNVSMFLKVI